MCDEFQYTFIEILKLEESQELIKMMDSIVVLEKQLSYVRNVLRSRKEHFQESFENRLFTNEKSAAEVYIHGITPLFQSCQKLLESGNDHPTPDPSLNASFGPLEQYLDLYARTISLLKKVEQQLQENDLNKYIDVFNGQTQMKLREWLNLNVMHTVTHIGQSLRLQSLYLRNKLVTAC
ncbi:MAG: hypothetical protein ACFFE8_10930 [Candidatus Heimdallarchaeota archaeon]